MAGPEDSTSSGHAHGNPSDTPDLRLQDSEEDSLLKEKHSHTALAGDHHPSRVTMNTSPIPTDIDTLLKTGDRLKIDLREGKEKKANAQILPASPPHTGLSDHSLQTGPGEEKEKKRANETPQTTDPKTSQPVCEDDDASDVFVSGHPHLFFFEEDDDVSSYSEEEEEEEDLGDVAFVDSDSQQGSKANANARNVRFPCRNTDKDSESLEEDKTPGDVFAENVPRSTPWTIPNSLSTSPGLTAVCRCSHGSQVVVRCQIVPSTCSDVRRVSSCPSAFSPVWTQMMDKGSAAQSEDGQSVGRKRLNTVSGIRRQPASPRQREDLDPESPHGDPARASFKGRNRSYSDSDVQCLLIREMSRELRRMGDEFNHHRGRRLTTVSEPIIEENGVFEM